MTPTRTPDKLLNFKWRFLASLIIYLKRRRPKIADITSIEIIRLPKTKANKGYDYKTIVRGKDELRGDIIIGLKHQEICTWELDERARRERRT